jgi:hypothetical protein
LEIGGAFKSIGNSDVCVVQVSLFTTGCLFFFSFFWGQGNKHNYSIAKRGRNNCRAKTRRGQLPRGPGAENPSHNNPRPGLLETP